LSLHAVMRPSTLFVASRFSHQLLSTAATAAAAAAAAALHFWEVVSDVPSNLGIK
jgi:hypothetical protein